MTGEDTLSELACCLNASLEQTECLLACWASTVPRTSTMPPRQGRRRDGWDATAGTLGVRTTPCWRQTAPTLHGLDEEDRSTTGPDHIVMNGGADGVHQNMER